MTAVELLVVVVAAVGGVLGIGAGGGAFRAFRTA